VCIIRRLRNRVVSNLIRHRNYEKNFIIRPKSQTVENDEILTLKVLYILIRSHCLEIQQIQIMRSQVRIIGFLTETGAD